MAHVCKQMYKNELVKLTLQVAEPQAQQLITDRRVTFADTIGIVGKKGEQYWFVFKYVMCNFSNSGGTIGLFLGASLVSGVEACYWIYKVTTISKLPRLPNSEPFTP